MAIQLPHASSTMNWREDFQNGDSVIPKLKRNATFNAAHSKTTYLLNRLDCVSNNTLYFLTDSFPCPFFTVFAMSATAIMQPQDHPARSTC